MKLINFYVLLFSCSMENSSYNLFVSYYNGKWIQLQYVTIIFIVN